MAPALPAPRNAGADQPSARDLKHELKAWEAEFQATQGRVPTKSDLLEHPDIANKYREYSRLKKAAGSSPDRAPVPSTPARASALLPLETSILALSLKRKAAPHASHARTEHPSTGAVQPALELGSAEIVLEEAACATLKRQRTAAQTTPPSTGAQTQTQAADSTACDAIAYTPPPSLLRHYYGQHTHKLSSSKLADLAAGAPLLTARPGMLVKTTSIPLSAFGAGPHSASPALPAPGRMSDGDDEGLSGSAAACGLADLDDGDLVVDSAGEGNGTSGAGTAHAGTAKRATQKRSTRRVKLKPIIEGEGRVSAARAADGHHLVSNNFYKLKIKSKRRGPQSAEDRRSAMYKRMVAKKKRATGDAAAPDGGAPTSVKGDGRAGSDGLDSLEDDGPRGGDPDDDDLEGDCQAAASPHPRDHGVLGRPLGDFATDEGAAGDPCALDFCKILRHVWGFGGFRAGQEEAIRRVVGGRSTLLSLATGAGKSVVYQLAAATLAAAHGGLTLVIMPLLSLMRDQVRQLPAGLQAVCMTSESHGQDMYAKAAARLVAGQAHLLFVSPERLQSPRFQAMMATKGMPHIRLAVVDEAHCADEWSHNFRPAYLQLPRLLQALGVGCVLAMTGTATAALAGRLCGMFGIDAASGVVRGSVLRKNIELSVVSVDVGARPLARTTAREDALVEVLRSHAMAGLGSIIVYVSTQATADRVAEYLTVRSIPAQSYHAGKHAAERARIQTAFMQASAAGSAGSTGVPIRVLVATVAFGMGLNKSDVRAVVHFNLPRSMEAYAQEIGRAGRDGEPARGVLLLATYRRPAPPDEAQQPWASVDAIQLRSWAHIAGVDRAAVRRLVQRLFPAEFIRTAVAAAAQAHAHAAPSGASAWSVTRTAVLEHRDLEADTDADHSTAQTLVGYLALAEPGVFRIEPDAHRRCMLRFTRTDLGSLAAAHRLFAGIAECASGGVAPVAQRRRRGIVLNTPCSTKPASSATVDVFELAGRLGAEPSDVIAELYQWRAKREVVLEWQDPSHVVKVTLDMSKFAVSADASSDPDKWCEQLACSVDDYISGLAEAACRQNAARVRDSLHRVHCIEAAMLVACQAAHSVEHKESAAPLDPAVCAVQSELLHASIGAYFAPARAEGESVLGGLREHVNRVCGDAASGKMLSGLLSDPATMYDNSATTYGDLHATWPDARARIAGFVRQHADQLTNARVVARIFHGLSGPTCSSSQWMWCPEWGSLIAADFEAVRVCAQEELVKLHCGPNVMA